MPIPSTMYTDAGLGLFTGVYANPETPLWLSAQGPNNLGANIQVSTIAVNNTGGIAMRAGNQPRPCTIFSAVTFDRLPDRFNTLLKQNISKAVPNFPDDREYLSVTAVGGLQYDDLAVAGIQLFGFQLTDPLINAGCAGRLTKGSLPYSLRLDTAVVETNDVKGNNATFSTINLSSFAGGSISTFSTLTASTITAGLITASSLTVSSLGFPAIAISSLTASTINAGVLTASSLNVSSFTLPNTLLASTLNAAQGNFSSLNVSSLVAGNVSTNSENVNQAYISSLIAPNIVAVTTQTTDLIAGTVFSAAIRATAPSAFISTGNVVAPNILTTSISTNNINASTFNTSLINATVGNFSTISVENFSTISTNSLVAGFVSTPLLSVSSIVGGNVAATVIGNVSSLNVSTNSIYANVATFSTLNAPSGSVTVSTINTGLVSTSVAVVKDMFMSSMVFNASLSPNFNIDMGGIVGGLIGYAGANTLGIGLGAVNLATGIASLAQGRQSGGINSNIFQTINGTAQLQYSTLGIPTQTTFVNTDSLLPNNVQGNIIYTSSFISSGTYCMRTISDPLNLANAAGIAGQAIQGFSEWTPVYPGFLTVASVAGSPAQTAFFDSASQSLINFGGNPTQSTLTMFSPNRVRVVSSNAVDINGASTVTITGSTININSGFPVSTVSINLNGNLTATSTLQSRQLNVSTISGGTFPVSIVPGILTSTLAVSSLTIGTSVTGSVSVSTLVSLGSTQLATSGASGFGVTVGSNAIAPLDGNSLSVAGDGRFNTVTTNSDLIVGYTDNTTSIALAPLGGALAIGTPLSAVITSLHGTISSFGSFTNIGAVNVAGTFSNSGSTIMQGGVFAFGQTRTDSFITRLIGSSGVTNANTGWLPQISTYTTAYENKMLLGQWQFVWGNTGSRVFAGGYQNFTFSNTFSTGTVAWMMVNGVAQTNTFANGSATASNTWQGAAANQNGSGTTTSLNYLAIGIAQSPIF